MNVFHKTRLVFVIITMILLASMPDRCLANGWAMNPEQVKELLGKPFEGKPVKEVARHFAHPSGYVSGYAIGELVGRGEAVVPEVTPLFKDSHPLVRSGAVSVMRGLYKFEPTEKVRQQQATPQIRAVLQSVTPLTEDPDADVRRAVATLIKDMCVESPEVHAIMLKNAAHPKANVRGVAIGMASGFLKDPEVCVKIAMTYMQQKGNPNRQLSHAQRVISKYPEHSVQAIPTLGDFLAGEAIPLRGMFAGIEGSLKTLLQHAKHPEVAKVLPCVCKVYTRKGWENATAREIFLKMGKPSAPLLRKFITSEKEFLRTAPDDLFKSNEMPHATRESLASRIKELEHVAECIENSKPFSIEFMDVESVELILDERLPEVDPSSIAPDGEGLNELP